MDTGSVVRYVNISCGALILFVDLKFSISLYEMFP